MIFGVSLREPHTSQIALQCTFASIVHSNKHHWFQIFHKDRMDIHVHFSSTKREWRATARRQQERDHGEQSQLKLNAFVAHTGTCFLYANAVSLMTVWQGRMWVTDGTMLGGGGGRSCAWATSYIDCSYTKDSPVSSQFECKLSNVSMHGFLYRNFLSTTCSGSP